jgi:hypothetical protein
MVFLDDEIEKKSWPEGFSFGGNNLRDQIKLLGTAFSTELSLSDNICSRERGSEIFGHYRWCSRRRSPTVFYVIIDSIIFLKNQYFSKVKRYQPIDLGGALVTAIGKPI